MTFFHHPVIMGDDLNKNIFTPNLWFMTEFDQTYIEDNVRLVECVKNVEKIDRMSDDERKKMFSAIIDTNYEKHMTNEEKMGINMKKLQKVMKFISRNYEFEKAKKQLIKCMAFIKLSRDFMHSYVDNKITKSALICDHYFKTNKYPFHWMSSNSLYSNYYPVVYITKCLREHCILLAWRVVFICLKMVTESIDFCSNLSKYIGNADNKVCDMSNQKRYASVKKYLFFALILLKQVIPAQMVQLSGNLKNQANTTGALLMPELNPYVVETYTRIVFMMMQQCFFVQGLSYFTTKTIASSSDVSLKCMMFFLNQRNYDILKRDDETENMDMTQKNIYTESVDVFINMCYDNEEMVSLLGAMFQLSYTSLVEMTNRVWKYHLTAPFHDIQHNVDEDDMLPSKDSIFFSEKIKKHFKSDKPEKRDNMMVNVYRRTLFATNCKNLLLGTCIYMECLLSCFEISKFDLENEGVMPYIVNLANKVELLFLPQYDRKLCAFEIMCWILNTLSIRRLSCDKIDIMLTKDRNKAEFEAGKNYSYLWLFVKKDRSLLTSATKPMMNNVKKFMSSIFTTNASNGKKITSIGMKSALFDARRKKREGSEDDENDIDDDCVASSSESELYDKKRINVPFTDEDLVIWSILIGYYPKVNDKKSKVFQHIETNNFSKNPSRVFIPREGFCKEYQDMLLSMNHAICEKAMFIKGQK